MTAILDPSDINPQIERLKASSECFQDFELQYHTVDGTVAPCCRIAQLCLASSVLASGSRGGIAGVLDYLRVKFGWGLSIYDSYFCACLEHSGQLGCVAKRAMCQFALHQYCSLTSSADDDFCVVTVQLIAHHGIEETRRYKSLIKDPVHLAWVAELCCYHECIGIVNKSSGAVVIWDDGQCYEYQSSAFQDAILSMRIVADASVLPSAATVTWSTYGRPIGLNSWVDIYREAAVVVMPVVPYSLAAAVPADPIVFISGVGGTTNPFSGSGVARGIREGFPSARLICADRGGSTLSIDSGMCDPVFDAVHISVIDGGVNGTCAEQYAAIVFLLEKDESSLYIPCRDSDVENLSQEKGLCLQGDAGCAACRILCPSAEAVALTEKPAILAATAGPLAAFFRLPAFFVIDAETSSLFEVQQFAEARGYPVYIKGMRRGCTKVHDWGTVRAALGYHLESHDDVFVQEVIGGEEHCLAFAAYKGELTGCVLMIKDTCQDGKVWDGTIRPVPAHLHSALAAFVSDSNWTGGGEIEYISDMGGDRWVIDFNPRFPAWIAASAFSGCNLPAELVAHALYEQSHAQRGLAHTPFPQLPGKRAMSANAHATFSKSLIEMPRCNHTVWRKHSQGMFFDLAVGQKIGKSNFGRVVPKFDETKYFNLRSFPEPTKAPMSASTQLFNRDLSHLMDAASKLLLHGRPAGMGGTGAAPFSGLCTPKRVLAIDVVAASMARQRQLLRASASAASASATQNNAKQCRVEDDVPAPGLQISMCVSVKTQPHRAVLMAALESGYIAECISMAEVHAALAAGFEECQIVLTGPGKFWDTEYRLLTKPLKCIFVDSLEELRVIAARLLDPLDWLECQELGVRFMPALLTGYSRFGLDCSDVNVVSACVALIATLPPSLHLSVQFHFASSTMGGVGWFALLHAFTSFSAEFARLCQRPLHTIDLGGGWTSYFLSYPDNQIRMQELFAHILRTFQAPHTPHVQFELGKSLSEMAGGVLTTVLSIRETIRPNPNPNPNPNLSIRETEGNLHTTTNTPHGNVGGRGEEEEEGEEGKAASRVIIIDASVADISGPHTHPVFWNKGAMGADWADGAEWEQLGLGGDLVWGRTCMEFDRLYCGVAIPAAVKVGDVLLIAATGSYDFTNSYDFGDGVGRDIVIL